MEEKFYNEKISNKGYRHAQKVLNKFKIIDLGDYQDLHSTINELLLSQIVF